MIFPAHAGARVMLPDLLAAWMPVLPLAADWSDPWAILIPILIVTVIILVVRFIVKGVFTFVKIALLVALGFAIYIGLSFLFGA